VLAAGSKGTTHNASGFEEQTLLLRLREQRGAAMSDTTIKKVEAASSPKGEMGQRYLVAGKRVSMRIWIDEPGGKLKGPSSREYETVGYVIAGSAELDIEGQTLNLKRVPQ
jgi:quercetin dioxygenase-like cupin family protein